ncbi:MAG: grasp-with-spasm system ATP-grasp peptide maturase [Bacteroidota bacterium]
MILIISQNEVEESTNHVIDWLDFLQAKYVRVNGADFEVNSDISLELDGFKNLFEVNNDQFNLSNNNNNINVIWYRRWSNKDFFKSAYLPESSDQLEHQMANHLHREFLSVSMAWFSMFEDKIWLNQPSSLTRSRNKIEILRKAKNVGLKIPNTLITNKKKILINFLKRNGRIITKCSSDIAAFNYKNLGYTHYTVEIEENEIDDMPNKFFPSLFQNFIDKQYEIRTFYLSGDFYSMAIFSQENIGTKLDFRRYALENPNKEVPYNLPIGIKDKLHKLMLSIDLNCGSIDLIRCKNGDYFFLEVNPLGQFGMVSIPCNYFIEESLAKFLISKDQPI